MYKVAIIVPYFGQLPNYFQLWLFTAGKNTEIDFLVFSDSNFNKYNVPENVHIFKMTFDEVKQRVANILRYKFVLHKPYKICDYRPLYGRIFSDYLVSYDFWAHCDPDIIWGNLKKFITEDIMSNYDKIYNRGHLTFYRNISNINNAVLTGGTKNNITSKDVYTSKYSAHFDEHEEVNDLITAVGGKIYHQVDAADIGYMKKEFVCMKHDKPCETVAAFCWQDGTLVGFAQNGDKFDRVEYPYVHLQKRKMELNLSDSLDNNFWIIPNAFVSADDMDQAQLTQYTKSDNIYEQQAHSNLRRRKLQNILDGALLFRLKRMIHK